MNRFLNNPACNKVLVFQGSIRKLIRRFWLLKMEIHDRWTLKALSPWPSRSLFIVFDFHIACLIIDENHFAFRCDYKTCCHINYPTIEVKLTVHSWFRVGFKGPREVPIILYIFEIEILTIVHVTRLNLFALEEVRI